MWFLLLLNSGHKTGNAAHATSKNLQINIWSQIEWQTAETGNQQKLWYIDGKTEFSDNNLCFVNICNRFCDVVLISGLFGKLFN